MSNSMASVRRLNQVCIINCNSSVGIEMWPPKSCEEAFIATNCWFFSKITLCSSSRGWFGFELPQVKEGMSGGRLSLGWVLWSLSGRPLSGRSGWWCYSMSCWSLCLPNPSFKLQWWRVKHKNWNHGTVWVGKDLWSSSSPTLLLCGGRSSIRSGCPKSYPAWRWTFPGIGHPELLQAGSLFQCLHPPHH